MNYERIQALVSGLEELDRRLALTPGVGTFDLEMWGKESSCGFAGCLVGWAAHERWLEPFGCKVELDKDTPFDSEVKVPIFDGERAFSGNSDTSPEDLFGKMLGVSPKVVERIIYASQYSGRATITDVRTRLQYLLMIGEEGFLSEYPDLDADQDWPED